MAIDDCLAHQRSYRQASIGGVSFTVLETEDTFGRRGPIHEFPDRDIPAAEDLGRKYRRFQISGYFNGDDHVSQYRRLVRMAESFGPKKLVHPVLGEEMVKVESLKGTHRFEEMERETRFTFELAEAGGFAFPIATSLPGLATARLHNVLKGALGGVDALADGLIDVASGVIASGIDAGLLDASGGVAEDIQAALSGLAGIEEEILADVLATLGNQPTGIFWRAFTLSNLPPNFVALTLDAAADAANLMADELAAAGDWVSQGETLAIMHGQLSALAVEPGDRVDLIPRVLLRGIDGIAFAARSSLRARESLQALQTWAPGKRERESVLLTSESGVTLLAGTTPASAQAAANVNMLTTTVRAAALLAEATLIFEDARAHFASYSEALDWHEGARALLWEEMEIAAARQDDTLFGMLRRIAVTIGNDVGALAYSLPSRRVVTLCDELPSLIAAHRLLGSASRAEEIEGANPHSSTWFMPRTLEFVT